MSPTPSPAPRRDAGRALRRAGWCALALVALWGVSQFVPSPAPAQAQAAQPAPERATGADLFADGTPVRTDAPDLDAGTVARSAPLGTQHQTPWGGFAVVVALLGGGAWWAVRLRRQQAGGGASGGQAAGALRSMGSLALAPGQTVHLVAVGPDVLAVGHNAAGLTTLGRWPADAFDAAAPPASGDGALLPSAAPAVSPAASFADVLGSYGVRLPGGAR